MSSKLKMADIMRALEKVAGAPMLTSNQCWELAQTLNAESPFAVPEVQYPRCTVLRDCNVRASGSTDALAAQHQGEPAAWADLSPGIDDERRVFLDEVEAQYYSEHCYPLTPVYTLQPAPVAVVLPEYRVTTVEDTDLLLMATAWNACLDKVKELNP